MKSRTKVYKDGLNTQQRNMKADKCYLCNRIVKNPYPLIEDLAPKNYLSYHGRQMNYHYWCRILRMIYKKTYYKYYSVYHYIVLKKWKSA